MELFFIRPLMKFFGVGWHMRFTSNGRDNYPVVEYVCAFCGNENVWQAGGAGFRGVAPVSKCCPQAVPYPVGREDFAAHLLVPAKLNNNLELQQGPFIDAWDSVPDTYPCTAQAPKAGLW
jgi:hypothetical protein